MDSHKPVGGDPGARRGCRWGGFDFYCRGIGAPPRVKTSVKDLPLPSPVVSTSRVTDSLPHSRTSGRVGGGTVRVPKPSPSRGREGTGPRSGTAGEAPWPSWGADAGAAAPGLSGKRCDLGALRAGDHSGDRGGGAGAGSGQSRSPPGSATPGPESCCPPYLRLGWTPVPWAGGRGAVLPIVGICLFGAGDGGRGARAQEGAGRPFPRVSFKGSPALPFPPSPPSPQPYLHFKSAL